MDAGEITDKGYINQRGCSTGARSLSPGLYAEPPDADVILPAR